MKCITGSLLIICICGVRCSGQTAFGTGVLKLDKEIALPGVQGRIDHMDANPKAGVLYMAALGNNTLEVIDFLHGRRIHTIGGLDEPQGVGFIPETDEIIVANGGSGDCNFYSAKNFEKMAAVHLPSDADDVRYDPTERKVYVGYGEGGIAIIDALTHKQTGDIKLPVHPEGFQLDKELDRIFVNLPGGHMIGVVDLKMSKLIAKWNTGNLRANFPMSIDLKSHRLFIGYRQPATLIVMNGLSGAQHSSSPMIRDVDDLYYDSTSGRIYVSGGSGAIDVFDQQGTGLRQISHILTRSGARTSLLLPSLSIFVLAQRASGTREASVIVYRTTN
ncbi:MAG: YncE family protein [Flavisolibacter sp.]